MSCPECASTNLCFREYTEFSMETGPFEDEWYECLTCEARFDTDDPALQPTE